MIYIRCYCCCCFPDCWSCGDIGTPHSSILLNYASTVQNLTATSTFQEVRTVLYGVFSPVVWDGHPIIWQGSAERQGTGNIWSIKLLFGFWIDNSVCFEKWIHVHGKLL